MQVSHGIEDTQTCPYCASSVIFMSLGISKIDQETITKELGDVSVVSLDDFSTSRLIGSNHVPVLFGVELRRELGGIDQITEDHRELSAFRLKGRQRSSPWRLAISWGGRRWPI